MKQFKKVSPEQYEKVLLDTLSEEMAKELAKAENTAINTAIAGHLKKYPKPIFSGIQVVDLKEGNYNMVLVGSADFKELRGDMFQGFDNMKLVGKMPYFKVKGFKAGQCTPLFTWAFPKMDSLANGRIEAPDFMLSFVPFGPDDFNEIESINDNFYNKRG